MSVKSEDLTSFDETAPFEQTPQHQQLRVHTSKRGRPRKINPEVLSDRRQLYLKIFQQLLSSPETCKRLFEGPSEAITDTIKQCGYHSLLTESRSAAWIQKAMRQATRTFRYRRAQVRFLADTLIAKECRTSLRYLRRVFNQTKRHHSIGSTSIPAPAQPAQALPATSGQAVQQAPPPILPPAQ